MNRYFIHISENNRKPPQIHVASAVVLIGFGYCTVECAAGENRITNAFVIPVSGYSNDRVP